MSFTPIKHTLHTISFFLFFLYCLMICSQAAAQDSTGIIHGMVSDGSTGKPLFHVAINVNETSISDSSVSSGTFNIQLKAGTYSLLLSLPGFQSKTVTNVPVKINSGTLLPVILFPVKTAAVSKKLITSDSVSSPDSVVLTDFQTEKNSSRYHYLNGSSGASQMITAERIEPGLERNGAQLIKYIGGVYTENLTTSNSLQTVTVNGLGERYNQVLLNGSLFNSLSSVNRSYPFALLPVEAIEKVSLITTGNTSIPGDYAGGTLNLKLKEAPEKNFFYVQLSGGFSDKTTGKTFYGDAKNSSDFLSFPGSSRNLPGDFPTPKSSLPFNSRTPEEQVNLAMKLNNNLAPVNRGNASPDDRILLGFGRTFLLKNNRKIGILSYLQQAKSQVIDNNVLQAKPDVLHNPYPFNNNTVLISSQSTDVNYRYSSLLSAVVNASLVAGRNKFSFFNVVGSTLSNTYTSRTNVLKPDEDTLAHTGLYYSTTHTVFYATQLQGEHALGNNGRFKLEWHAAYTYRKEESPDERSFLLRQDSLGGNTFQIAQVSAAPFNPRPTTNPDAGIFDPNLTNSARLWRHLSEHNYEGAINIAIPFNLFHQAQHLSGGVYVQGRYRIFYSTLLPTAGSGYYTLNNVLAPANYASGNAVIRSYYSNFGGSYSFVYANNRGNYNASANVGAAYIRFENKLTKNIAVQWGARAEANTQLVSNTEYNYVAEQSKPVLTQLDKNNYVSKFQLLPAVNIRYSAANIFQLQAGYFKTVNRPELQELTAYRYYDPTTFSVLIGNPVLQNSVVDNFNGSLSWLPKSGTAVTVSGFYKKMSQPIENLVSGYTSATVIMQPVNMPKAKVYGLTADVQLALSNFTNSAFLSGLYLFGNANFLSSKVEAGYARFYENEIAEHTLSGTPDYTFNGGLMYKKEGYPSLSLAYSGRGDCIYAVGYGSRISLGNGNVITSVPDYRLKANSQLNLQISQKLLRSKLQIMAGVANLVNSSYTLYQDLNGNKKFDEPLLLQTIDGKGGFYTSGTDNTITHIAAQRNFYLSVSYTF